MPTLPAVPQPDACAGGGEEARHAQAFELHGDEPTELLGDDHGPSATEALLHALAACLNTTFIYHAAARGVEIDELELELEGDLDVRGFTGVSDEVRRGYSGVRVTFRVKSDAPREKTEELVRLARKYSPVHDMVTNPTPVEARLEVKQGAPAPTCPSRDRKNLA